MKQDITELSRQCFEIFHSLASKLSTGFDWIVYDLARQLQIESFQRHTSKARKYKLPLSLEKQYYVYILLDPRKPGKYKYALPGGLTIVFDYEPFYIGKGKGNRANSYLRFPKSKRSTHTLNVRRKIFTDGKIPIVIQGNNCIEAQAFAKEILLIQSIGKQLDRTGPLTNRTNGGSGGDTIFGYKAMLRMKRKISRALKGRVLSKETLKRMSIAQTGRKFSEEHKQRMSVNRKALIQSDPNLKSRISFGTMFGMGPYIPCELCLRPIRKTVMHRHVNNGKCVERQQLMKAGKFVDTYEHLLEKK